MTASPPLHGCFVIGTGPGVGKTHVRAALLHWCAQQGWRSGGLKPVAAGTVLIDGQPVNEDLRALREAEATPTAVAAHLDTTDLRSVFS
ncbi:dethiobiotin synthase (plasmid) [Polaromonas sp. P1-6]|nr:dethiobiotin synthase [Polaromonas sp. P1-6]